jgi:ABC-2 type transport system ATP-binding protein
MDEPTENLDPDNRITFYEICAELTKLGKTLFISTHNLAELEKYANYCVIISGGEIKHQGVVDKKLGLKAVYEKYRDRLEVYEGDVLFRK